MMKMANSWLSSWQRELEEVTVQKLKVPRCGVMLLEGTWKVKAIVFFLYKITLGESKRQVSS